MINSNKELKFYLAADLMMNRGKFKYTFKERIKEFLSQDLIMRYLSCLRKLQYHNQLNRGGIIARYYKWKYDRLGVKLGFSISPNVFGYGLVLPHYGTIVVGSKNCVGNYAVLHTSTCITANGKVIGDGLYLSTGAKITSKICLGDNISIGANSLVNKDFTQGGVLLGGMPAKIIKVSLPWYVRDGKEYAIRVKKIEELKKTLHI